MFLTWLDLLPQMQAFEHRLFGKRAWDKSKVLLLSHALNTYKRRKQKQLLWKLAEIHKNLKSNFREFLLISWS